MIKVAFYDTKQYDLPSFEKYGKERGINFKFLEAKLDLETAQLAHGCNGVCVFVNDDVNKIGRTFSANDGQRPEMHQARAVAIQAPDPTVRFSESNPEGNHTGMPHGTHCQKVHAMGLMAGFPKLKDFTGKLAGCTDKDTGRIRQRKDTAQGSLPKHGIAVPVIRFAIRLKRSFPYNNGSGSAAVEDSNQVPEMGQE